MRTPLVWTGVLALLLALAIAASEAARAQPAAAATLQACDAAGSASGGDSTLATDPALSANLPPGLALTVLADTVTEQWPPHVRGLTMTVRHLTLEPGVTAAMRQTQGPLLFYVESGSVGFSINGQPADFGPGATVLIERGQNYQLRNDDQTHVATVLRLQIVPPGKETLITRGEMAEAEVRDVETEIVQGPPYIQSRLLLTAAIPAVEGKNHLVLGCLVWAGTAADPGDAAHPGPVAYLVLQGELLVGDTGTLGAGECVVFPDRVPHRLRAGAVPPVVLVIGVVPVGTPFWQAPVADAGNEARSRLDFSCEPQAEPDVGR